MSESSETADLRNRLARVEEELDRFRLTLEVVGTIDLDTGILNRNGILEALERGRRWLERRGDVYGMIVVWLPGLEITSPKSDEEQELLRHLAASIAAGVREVDEVGRIDTNTFGAVLCDLQPDSVGIVANRVTSLVETLVRRRPQLGEQLGVGATEVHDAERTSPSVLEATLDLAQTAPLGSPNVGKL